MRDVQGGDTSGGVSLQVVCIYLVRAELGQLAGCEVSRGLRRRAQAAVHSRVQGDDRGQQFALTGRETETTLV